MKAITSPDNPAYKQAMALKSKKGRDKTGCYLIEGPNLIEEALQSSAVIDSVFFYDDRDGRSCLAKDEINRLAAALSLQGIRLYSLRGPLFQKLSDTVTPQGILASVRKKTVREEEFFAPGGNLVVLDRLQDPGNLGTILRTAEAAGFAGVLAIKGTGDIYSQKTVRSAAGSLFRLPVMHCDTQEAVVSLLRKYNKRTFATVLSAAAYYESDLRRDTALIVGNEGNGISPFLIAQADERITIPMEAKTESLNAAIACAIIMYEAVRQNRMEDK